MGMEALADLAQSEQVIDRLLPMVKAYRGWITQQPKHPVSDKDQNDTAKQLRAQAEDCAKRIENGTAASAQAQKSAAGARPMAQMAWRFAQMA
ncbi:MAG: hypothetical protein ACO27O_08230, partial [Hylemonella sp.]